MFISIVLVITRSEEHLYKNKGTPFIDPNLTDPVYQVHTDCENLLMVRQNVSPIL